MSLRLSIFLFICFCFGRSTIGQEQAIVVFRQSQDASRTKSSIQRVLNTIPSFIKDAVLNSGCKIVIVPTVSEYLGMGYADKPRGYNDGGGYDNARGL